MTYFIIIREYKESDFSKVYDVVKNAYLSQVGSSWYNGLTREITFQSIVMISAVMFIFLSVPILFCILSIPVVMVSIYFCIYSAFLVKSAEVMTSKRPLQTWVAEACQPMFFIEKPENISYRIILEREIGAEDIDIQSLHREIIGTVSVSKYLHMEKSSWLFRLAVDKKYRHKGVGHSLVDTVKQWSKSHKYERVLLAMSECQEGARSLFITTGFQMRQMYHKQILGSVLMLLMFQLECDLLKTN